MMSKKALFALALPLSIATSYAKVQIIPKAEQDLKLIEKTYVLKNAKGTFLQSLSNVTPENWFNLSPFDGAEGLSTEEAYKEYGMPFSQDIIVAVIDSGVDVNHEDLQGKIWINSGEIANNNIDDDQNGYVDDVFGWNFIGGKNGMAKIVEDSSLENGIRLEPGDTTAQVDADSLEITRELVRMKKLKRTRPLTSTEEEYLAKLDKEVTETVENANNIIQRYTEHLKVYMKSARVLASIGVTDITLENVMAVTSNDSEVLEAKRNLITLLNANMTLARLNRILSYYGDQVAYYYNEDFNPRTIVGDNYTDLNERYYGNNDVIGPDSSHGTHVAGIIAATRDNSLGMKGVATNVKIMALRVVPNGDERDKDVANSIRYAVDNGAKIINMSFGKSYSPYKSAVDEAVRYAESKGVLLVHAAGNSNQDNDVAPNFPNRHDLANATEFTNWLEIGASSFEKGLSLAADFTNYGQNSVDFFAPGVDIYSTTPYDSYDTYSGTSMASPAAAGVAALMLSFDESMNAREIRSIMIQSSREYEGHKVYLPGTQDEVLFSSLSKFGTIVDAFDALEMMLDYK